MGRYRVRMIEQVTAGWAEFSVATAGAGAALAGLVMVVISVNVREILASPSLPARAGAAVGSLVLAAGVRCANCFLTEMTLRPG